jgi:hypothetical protein
MTDRTISPLEAFVRDSIDGAGGVWDEVEPQVYDLLLPTDTSLARDVDREIVRVAFDPEALPEHPGSQLAGFGTPLVDQLLESAARLGRFARAHVGGLNFAPQDLLAKVRRTLTLSDGLKLKLATARTLDFPQAMFWFEATLVSDQKESYVLPVAIDLHYARQVRHLEELLREDRLSDEPSQLLPQAKRCHLAEAYPLARAEVVRTLGALAGARRRELSSRVNRQVVRMTRYYADLRGELNLLVERAKSRGDDTSRYGGRRAAIDREERLRVAELRQKSILNVHLRLANLLIVHQPKLLLGGILSTARWTNEPLPLVWDPLVGTLEAVPCPACLCPTFRLEVNSRHRVGCPACLSGGRG